MGRGCHVLILVMRPLGRTKIRGCRGPLGMGGWWRLGGEVEKMGRLKWWHFRALLEGNYRSLQGILENELLVTFCTLSLRAGLDQLFFISFIPT